ncbi:MAG: hypothetical protein KDD61_10790, partial [Bdellovibrionales bacterium]|nr:hypothetical protein [Bdellovibrionales bacterium]
MNLFTALFTLVFVPIFLVSCAEPGDLLDLKKPKVKQERQKVGNVKLVFKPMLDVLFVVDDSGSMDNHQKRLAKNVSLLTKGIFANQLLDLHLGVLATTGSTRGGSGVLQGVPRFITKTTPLREARLASNIQLGTSGDFIETVFAPVHNFFTPDRLTGPNQGFYREEAYLALVFITDAVDQSDISAVALYEELLQLKNNDSSKLIGYGVFVPSGDRSCQRDDSSKEPQKIERFMDLISEGQGNNTFSLCAEDYGEKLAALGDDLARRIGMF